MLTCNICLEKVDKDIDCCITECRHKFHTSCLMKWCSNNSTCPVCRLKLFETEERQSPEVRRLYQDPIDALLDTRLELTRSNTLIETGRSLIEGSRQYNL